MENDLNNITHHQPLDLVLNENSDHCLPDTDEEPNTHSNGSISSNSKRICKKRTKYQRIDDVIRQKIIEAVVNEGQMLKTAAKKYKINYSSAKSIFHTYRKEGRVNKKAVRERNAKKYIIGKIPDSKDSTHSDSTNSPTTMDSPTKESPQLNALKSYEQSSFPTSLKASLLDQTLSTQRLLQNDQLLSKLNITTPKSTYPFTLPLSMQNPNLTQQIIAQVNNGRMYEELANSQRMLRSQFACPAGKNLMNPLSAYPSMQGLQSQMQSAQFALGALGNQKAAYSGMMPFKNMAPMGNLGM